MFRDGFFLQGGEGTVQQKKRTALRRFCQAAEKLSSRMQTAVRKSAEQRSFSFRVSIIWKTHWLLRRSPSFPESMRRRSRDRFPQLSGRQVTGWSAAGRKNGVYFVNDSKGTNPDAAIRAVLVFSRYRADRRRLRQGSGNLRNLPAVFAAM